MTVPGTYPVSIGGHEYLLDLRSTAYSYSNQFSYETIPLLNPQTLNTAGQVSESNLNPEGLWRRSQDSWHKGAGQTYMDKPESDSARFRSSLGIEVFNKGQISLLGGTTKTYNVTGGAVGDNLKIISAGLGYVYLAVDTTLYSLSNPLTGTGLVNANIQAGESAQTIQSIASDGWQVYAALGSNGIHKTAFGLTTSSHYSDLSAQTIGFAAGRFMAAYVNSIYNITAGGAAPAALYTHPSVTWQWTGFAEAKGFIYISGYAGDKSAIYKTSVKPDGTALDIPSVAASLPDGETANTVYGYLGFILIGTNNGVRFALPDSSGNLQIGALIQTNTRVVCFEGQGSFVWFGWTNYDSTHTGLGRLDLRTLVDGSAPAYASDIMAVDQGGISTIITYNNKRVFAVANKGIYAETDARVSTGTIDSGLISYGLPESKIAMFVDVRYSSLAGSDQVLLANQSGSFTSLGTNTASSITNKFPAQNVTGDLHEIRHIFTRDATLTSTGPVLTRHTLESQVTVNMGAYWYVPVILASEQINLVDGQDYQDVLAEFNYLSGLASSKATVDLVILGVTYSVTVQDVKFNPSHLDSEKGVFQGTMLIKMKTII